MVPDLPEPHRTFGVMAIVGTPGVAVFANDHLITTSPADTAYVVSATGAMSHDQFRASSVRDDCRIASDDSSIDFGDDVHIEAHYPDFSVVRRHPEAEVQLTLAATDKVSWFADIRGGLYQHWSLLCKYDGWVNDTAVSGLATFEYARGVGTESVPGRWKPTVPAEFFTYHVINIDERTQVLYAELRGPFGVVIARSLYVRGLTESASEYPDALLVVRSHEERDTPTGRPMALPVEFHLGARDDSGRPLLDLDARCTGDWAYGLGAGFVGSHTYDATFRGEPVTGTAYIEYVDLRRTRSGKRSRPA